MPSAQKPKKEKTVKHYKAVLKALKEVLAEEKWTKTYGDEKLAELVKAKGVFASHPIISSVRQMAGIGDAYERKMQKFAEASAKAAKK